MAKYVMVLAVDLDDDLWGESDEERLWVKDTMLRDHVSLFSGEVGDVIAEDVDVWSVEEIIDDTP